MKTILFLALAISSIYAPSVLAKSMITNSGGSCASQGAWTARAIEQSKTIMSTVERLKDDPDCKSLVSAIREVDAKSVYAAAQSDDQLADGPGAKYETLPADLNALRTSLLQSKDNTGLNALLSPVLAKSTVDLASNNVSLLGSASSAELKGMQNRIRRTSAMGESILTALFSALPNNQKCLQKDSNADSGMALIVASIRLMAAFSSSNETNGQSLAALIGQFNTFLREMKYNKIINQLNIAQFWTEMSCLIETTQQSYCSVKDEIQLLEYQANESKILIDLKSKLKTGSVKKDSAIEGYVLVTREVPTISSWLVKVISGTTARNQNQADFKNNILTTINSVNQNINSLQGIYNQNLVLFQGAPSLEAKQQNIRQLLQKLTAYMTGREGGDVNFFTQAVDADLIPFYLIGRNKIPDEVLGVGVPVAMTPTTFLKSTDRVSEFSNPDALMGTILDRLTSISELAMKQSSKYFADNMTVDNVNLIDESLTDSSVTVYQSLKNVRDYLVRLQGKFSRGNPEARSLTLSMSDTISRLNKVLNRFDAILLEASKHSLDLNVQGINKEFLTELSNDDQEKILKMHKDLIGTIYEQFNLLMQKETFLSQRLSTYVRFDLNQRLKSGEDMSPYVEYLLVASGDNVMNRIYTIKGVNAAEVEADLSEAQRINRNNIDQVEELLAGDLWTYINQLSKDTGNDYVVKKTENPFRPLYTVITDLPYGIWENTFSLPRWNGVAKQNSQDEDKVLSFLRAKACIQTLGFKEWVKFKRICKGAVLESRLTSTAAKELNLKFSYDELAKSKELGGWDSFKSMFGSAPPQGARYQGVCTLRDFFRNNQVYWMTLDFNKTNSDITDIF